mmetsp:Transcript_4458/g.12853  ORF Transcript_4458/g.12853 Transcript_4458/m.12853 type:complete len:202 (-) Transcript_4458:1179-1784(-)
MDRRRASGIAPRSAAAGSEEADDLAAARRCVAADSLNVMSFSMLAAELGSATARAPSTAAAWERRARQGEASCSTVGSYTSRRASGSTSSSTSSSSPTTASAAATDGTLASAAAITPATRSSSRRCPVSLSCSTTPVRSTYSTHACACGSSPPAMPAPRSASPPAAAFAGWIVPSMVNSFRACSTSLVSSTDDWRACRAAR